MKYKLHLVLLIISLTTVLNSLAIRNQDLDPIDSTELYYTNVINIKDKSTMNFTDSLFDFVVFVNEKIKSTDDSLSLYIYLVKIEPFVDGILGEYVSSLYFDLWQNNPLLFYTILDKRQSILKENASDLSLIIELIGKHVASKELETKGYLNTLKNQHKSDYSKKVATGNIENMFDFIEEYFI